MSQALDCNIQIIKKLKIALSSGINIIVFYYMKFYFMDWANQYARKPKKSNEQSRQQRPAWQ